MSLGIFAVTTGDGEGGNEHAREAKLLLCLLCGKGAWREGVDKLPIFVYSREQNVMSGFISIRRHYLFK
jgi:hypothetical protein